MPPTSLYSLSLDALRLWVTDLGEPAYRANQLWHWLYEGLASDFEAMSDLPKALRARLADQAVLHSMEPVTVQESADGLAEKTLYRLRDGHLVEAVLMHYVDPADEPEMGLGQVGDAVPTGRHTLCLSTQVGCAMACAFCATGRTGLQRDLDVGECVEQVVHAERRLRRAGERLSNVVYMGMGEPLANWGGTWGSVATLTDERGLSLGARRITISTVGIVPGIDRLARQTKPVRLAVSLHAPDDVLRRQLVPVDALYPLDHVLEACRRYQASGGRRVTFEYVLIRGVNDAPDQARRLGHKIRDLGGHVNLIPLNPTDGVDWLPSRLRDVRAFERALASTGVPVSVRERRGVDIDAGCGQLRNRAAEGLSGRTLRLAQD